MMVRRDSKDRSTGPGMDHVSRQDCKDRERLSDQPPELLPKQDSKDRLRNGVDCKHESKERLRDQPPELLPRQNSKERARNSLDSHYENRDKPPELLPREDSKDRARGGVDYWHDQRPDLLPRQDSKERMRNELEHKHEGRIDQPPEIIPRQETSRGHKEKNGYPSESKQDARSSHNGGDVPPPLLPRQDSRDLSRTGLEVRRDSTDRNLNGADKHHYDVKHTRSPTAREYRSEKERANRPDSTPRREKRGNYTMDQSKAQDRNSSTTPGQPSSTSTTTATPTRQGRSSGSPPIAGNDVKGASKYGHSPSVSANPSPMGTPQRKATETHSQMPQMPWVCGDTTMLDQIERKRTLCKEIRSRQHPQLQKSLERRSPDRSDDKHQEHNQCKQESTSALPSWSRSNGAKKIRPPPYPTQKAVFWDTAI
uniref:Neuronal tyrosine-phosphorylated phosphoinositide-3-kinase adapter C-terminal domain-containing protein n=1 Tax=Neogobius melanostomus TaxID=47308 RepID=A0A8C6WSD0_9GOBI